MHTPKENMIVVVYNETEVKEIKVISSTHDWTGYVDELARKYNLGDWYIEGLTNAELVTMLALR